MQARRGTVGPGPQASNQAAAARPPGVEWLGAWWCILALAVWLAQLSAPWLLGAALGAALWCVAVARRADRWSLALGALLWVAVGVGGGIQYQLWQVSHRWAALQRSVEDGAAEALNTALDELVERGERAVAGAAGTVQGQEGPARSPRLFNRLEMIRRASDLSAVVVFDSAGSPIAWAGEHRGSIPPTVVRGASRYILHEGPLFTYLYFTRPVRGGGTAAAALLLESELATDGGVRPFAAWFAERHGLMPRFSLPERARGESVWDWSAERPILSVSFTALTQQAWWDRVTQRGRRGGGVAWLAALALLTVGWYRRRMPAPGVPVVLITVALLIVPLGAILGLEGLFSTFQFVLPLPWDMSLGTLLVLLTGTAVWLLTRVGSARPAQWIPWWAQAALVVAYLPMAVTLVRRSATGGLLANQPGGGFPLQLATTLLVAIPLFLLLRHGRSPVGDRRPRAALLGLAAVSAAGLAVGGVSSWQPDRPLPLWVLAAWAVPYTLVALALPRSPAPRRSGLRAWMAAGLLAATFTLANLWTWHVEAKLESAERDLARLGTEANPFLDFLLRTFAEKARHFSEGGEQGVNLLYHSWIASGLAHEGYEARLSIWRGGELETELRLTDLAEMPELVPRVVAESRGIRDVVLQQYTRVPGLHYLLLVPLPGERILSVAVPPRSRLGDATALARFLHPDTGPDASASVESLYLVPSSDPAGDSLMAEAGPGERVVWLPTETGWRSEARAHFPSGWMHAHLFVRTSAPSLLLIRGILVGTALLSILLVLWAGARLICGELAESAVARSGWSRSFRGRLTLALFAFFLLPTGVFGVVAYSAVSREVVRSAEGVARRAAGQAAGNLWRVSLAHIGREVDADLLLYRHGRLEGAAAPEVLDLGLFDAWLPPEVYLTLASGEDLEEVEARRLGENRYLVAYRRLDPGTVVAAPIPLASDEIARRQTHFRDIALLMSLLGAGLSVVLSLLVGRTLARPIDELSRAAATVGAGNLRVRLPETRPDEFGSVYRSFNRMVDRLRRARAALIRETRRTETIVAEAATGVLALDSRGKVELVNPRAAEILGVPLEVDRPLPRAGALLEAVHDAFTGFWRSGATESGAELDVDGRIVRLRLRRLSPAGGASGAVVALEDVTDEVRTARVLAWGEMARQVAHEIKNPLTPIKLSVQHLRRAFVDGRADYAEILERNVDSILQEIDRLGEIARAFARFGTPQPTVEELESVDVVRAVEEILGLYRGAGEGIRYAAEYDSAAGARAVARVGELKEVLVNLLENAREALDGAGEIRISVEPTADRRWVDIVVADTGEGIPPELLPRIFEPHFSTRTSGTGLGLAIVRRMVESWGGEVAAESEPGEGTRMRLRLPRDPGDSTT